MTAKTTTHKKSTQKKEKPHTHQNH